MAEIALDTFQSDFYYNFIQSTITLQNLPDYLYEIAYIHIHTHEAYPNPQTLSIV